MKKQDLISMLLTFVVGVVAGGYLFLTGFAPQFLAHFGATNATYSDFTIDARAYGGCSRTASCPSFQIRNDGSFSYLPKEAAVGVVPVTGTLPNSYMNGLRQESTRATLTRMTQVSKPTTCASYSDGIDYHYDITFQSVVYRIDTCGTTFTKDSGLARALDKAWNYFQTVQ